MFWKKQAPRISGPTKLLQIYLSSVPFFSTTELNPASKAAVQVFILGMVDMLRQKEKLSSEEFLSINEESLSHVGLLPDMSIQQFVDHIGKVASSENVIEEMLAFGAQSIRMFVTESDPEAPIDVLMAIKSVETNAKPFSLVI